MWSALGHVFEVVGAERALAARLDRIFEGLTPDAAERALETVPMTVDAFATTAEALDDLVSRVTLRAIAAAEGSLLFHAGAVGDSDGRSAVLCGPSGSGKSTLTVRLVEGGFRYLTDETACLDPDSLSLRPYPKPVSIKVGSQAVLPHLGPGSGEPSAGSWLVPPSMIDPSPLPDRLWLPALVIFPTYRPGSGLQVHPVPPAEAAFLLGEHSSRLARVRGGGLPALARLARRVDAFRVVHDDLDAAAEAVADLWAA